MQHLTIRREGPLAVLTVNREKALNALSSAVLGELLDAASELESDQALRAVVVTGAGDKAFVAGADIAELAEMEMDRAEGLSSRGASVGRTLERSRLVWIAAVNGFALGGGCELALCCDFIYASDRGKFGLPEVKLGVIPGFGGTQRLARRVGMAKAKELTFTGDVIGAEEALRIGLCDRVFPHGELLEQTMAAAGRIAANGPLAVAEAKRVIQQGWHLPLEEGLGIETEAFAGLFSTEDQREGMRAFLDKRPAAFKGK
jgi:enoyl-CoA hydratase